MTSASKNSSGFDNFLYGMALSNHATYLSTNWGPGNGLAPTYKVVAYMVGMGEHLLYLLFKVTTLVTFLFLNTILMLHYLCACIQDKEESEITGRQIRLLVGLLVLGETIPGACIDLGGILCPPLAYQLHTHAKERITRRYFEKWGIIDHTLSKEDFVSLNYFIKI